MNQFRRLIRRVGSGHETSESVDRPNYCHSIDLGQSKYRQLLCIPFHLIAWPYRIQCEDTCRLLPLCACVWLPF
jgi:hypothetical protein